jgi:hypothetical protein
MNFKRISRPIVGVSSLSRLGLGMKIINGFCNLDGRMRLGMRLQSGVFNEDFHLVKLSFQDGVRKGLVEWEKFLKRKNSSSCTEMGTIILSSSILGLIIEERSIPFVGLLMEMVGCRGRKRILVSYSLTIAKCYFLLLIQ